LVEKGLKCSFDSQVDIRIFGETSLVDVHHFLSQVDDTRHKVIMLEFLLTHQFVALLNDVG
jgi:hypothetical protein